MGNDGSRRNRPRECADLCRQIDTILRLAHISALDRDNKDAKAEARAAWFEFTNEVPAHRTMIAEEADIQVRLASLQSIGTPWSTMVKQILRVVGAGPQKRPKRKHGEPQEMPEGVPDAAVLENLLKTNKLPPQPAPTVGNLEIILSQDYRWLGRICYNTMRRRVEMDGELADEDQIVACQIWIERVYRIIMTKSSVRDAVRRVAKANPENPVRSYLESLRWDGKPRINDLFRTYFEGKGDDDDAVLLLGAFGSRWMISAVARACRAPVKVDTLPVLYGAKGVKKSSACSLLFGDQWFADTPIDPAKKDAMEQLVGIWLYEWAEFDQWLVKRGDAKIRSFLSSKSDHFRWSHGEDVIDHERTGVFVGTTNVPEFSPDEERRFWPVHVLAVDIAAIRRDRDQLWAEAKARFDKGETWWLNDVEEEAFKRYFQEFEQLDPWEEQACAAARDLESSGVREFTINAIMAKMGLSTRDMTSEASSRVGVCLRRGGYEKHRPRTSVGRSPMWRRVKTDEK